MSGLKEIRRRIGSVKNTKQITRAMKLVSAAKLRRAQNAAEAGKLQTDELSRIFSAVTKALPDSAVNPLAQNDCKHGDKVRFLILGGERGLCGAYNTNVNKVISRQVKEVGDNYDIVAIGKRAISYANKLDTISGQKRLILAFEGASEDVTTWDWDLLKEKIITDYLNGEYSKLVVIYTKFVSTMNQEAIATEILPFCEEKLAANSNDDSNSKEYKFSPDAKIIFESLSEEFLISNIKQMAMETKASEHASRMTAMDSATNNANDLLDSLQLSYNRARQSAITKELLDILGGAEAISS